MAAFCQHYRIQFRDLELLRLALTHRSYLSVTGRSGRESNERLEFLGDSVLGLVTSEFLFRSHPTEHEGQLTKTKSLLVSKAILARRALKMGLGRFMFMSHSEIESGGRQRLSILADGFESVIGAIYLDQGFEAARGFIHEHLLSEAREISADKRHTNYKSHLQEYVQSTYRTHPVYRIRREVGPDHSKQFVVDVMVGRRVLGSGRGQNKKDAEQGAARDALDQVTGRRSDPEAHAESAPRAGRTGSSTRTADHTESEPRRESRKRGRRPATRVTPAPTVEAQTEIDDDDHDHEDEVRKAPARRLPPTPTRIEAARMAAQSVPVDAAMPEDEVDEAPRYEDADDEIGRPEGPLEERHVDPFSLEESEATTERAPAADVRGPDLGRSVVSPLSRMRRASLDADASPSTSERASPEPSSSDADDRGPSPERYGRRGRRRR
jgi:ribonuclease III